MQVQGECLEDLEYSAIDVFGKELSGPIALADRAFGLINICSAKVPSALVADTPESLRVCLSLLVRLANDIRAIRLLSNYGYAVQAMSLLAPAMEAGYAIAYIGCDEVKARKWVSHTDMAHACWPTKHMIEGGLKQMGWLEEADVTDIQNCVHMRACTAKHSNPVFQRLHGYECDGSIVLFRSGPSLGEPSKDAALRAAWFAILNAANTVVVALASFVECHLSAECQDDLREEIGRLLKDSVRLVHVGKSRWHDEKPHVSG